ncbi:MAG: hypothetical protein LBJ03_02075, partial [Holosporales bacterium]|nr:hypothetical protein [Holosporales bacterium]
MSLPFVRSGMCDALSNTEPHQSRGVHQDLFDERNATSTQPELRLGGREDLLDCQFCELVLFKNLLGKHVPASDESFQSEMNLLTEVDMN